MRVNTIEIRDYKAFLGSHKIKVGGKNLFIYGENGSGKSSLYYALKDFFQSSIEDIDLNELENVFVPTGKQGNTAIKVTFKPGTADQKKAKTYTFNSGQNDTRDTSNTSIRDGNKLKSFLTYKHLLAVHHLKKDDAINLFDLLVNGVLKHFKYTLTGGNELGELWNRVLDSIAKTTGKEYPSNKKKTDVNSAIKAFNEAFDPLFDPASPEFILKYSRPILDRFNHRIELELHFPQIRPSSDYNSVEGAEVKINLRYAGKSITKPHLFLNEARLSAIAISIYLGMVKRHIQGIPCKILFLDDIFIGLDISNRLPLLEILETEFPDYQIFITTYDKPWFEHVRQVLQENNAWKTMEFYAKLTKGGTEVPLIFDDQNLIIKAEQHLLNCDYKAAAVYARSAFEKMLIQYSEKKRKSIVFKSKMKNYSSQDFWKILKADLPKKISSEIEAYRALVLNPFSHYNTEKHEIKSELTNALTAIKNLEHELRK